jgi:hypothetical protein
MRLGVSLPVGNDLLNMYGYWLFHSALKLQKENVPGRASACAILCQIFVQNRMQDINDSYYTQFYRILHEGLTSDPEIINAIITNSSDLFSSNLNGVRSCITSFTKAVIRILPHTDEFQLSPENKSQLRASAIDILGQMFVFCTRYPHASVSGIDDIKLRNFDELLSNYIDGMFTDEHPSKDDDIPRLHMYEIL